jgi:hypothetical protein
VELVRVAERAESRGINVPGGNSGGKQLAADERFEVDSRSLGRFTKLDRHFRTYFKAARSDARSDGCMKIPGAGVPPLRHGRDGFLRDSGDGASPSGMYGCDGAIALVSQQYRKAVGRLNAYHPSRCVREQGVTLGEASWAIRIHDDIGVDLPQSGY